MHKIFAINLGATSTKLAYWEGSTCLAQESIVHSTSQLSQMATLNSQLPLRTETVKNWAAQHGIDFASLDAFVSRGGLTQPVPGGVIRINEAMVEQGLSGDYGVHPCNLGVKIAFDLTQNTSCLAIVVDSPSTCELESPARFSGLKEVSRTPKAQPLNARACAKDFAKQQGKHLEDVNVIVATMGGGTTAMACKAGKLVDANEGVLGEGPFSTNRCGGVSLGPVVEMCYSGAYTHEEMHRHLNGEAGLIAYLGTGDARKIEQRIAAGDTYAQEVLDAFCYQVAKEIGAMAAVLEGAVDAVILSGGMAYSQFVVDHISKRVQFIAPVVVYAGGDEMAALWQGAAEALDGSAPIQEFVPE